MRRVEQAMAAGVDGVVSSPLEAAKIRAAVPDNFLVVTPGIRMPDGDKGDQKRIATPGDALRSAALNVLENMRA